MDREEPGVSRHGTDFLTGLMRGKTFWQTRAGKTTSPSSRANAAPRQACIPENRGRDVLLVPRLMSRSSGRSNASGSRLAAPNMRRMFLPAWISIPSISWSTVASLSTSWTGGSKSPGSRRPLPGLDQVRHARVLTAPEHRRAPSFRLAIKFRGGLMSGKDHHDNCRDDFRLRLIRRRRPPAGEDG